VLTYIPLSQRSSHANSPLAARAHRAWRRAQRYEDAIIASVDTQRARIAKRLALEALAAMPVVGRVS
jgi:hypothetical protein